VTPLRTPTITSQVDDAPQGTKDNPDGKFKVPNADGKGWTSVQSAAAFLGDYTIHSQDASPAKSNFAEWRIEATSATPELFATWVALPGNATNATYQIFQNLPNKLAGVDDLTLLLTVVVDQTRSPNDALLFGTTLAQSLGSVTLTNWVPGTMLSVRLLTLGADGNVVADAVFDPPMRPAASRVSAEFGAAIPDGDGPGSARTAVGFDLAQAEAIAGVPVVNPSPTLGDSMDALALDINHEAEWVQSMGHEFLPRLTDLSRPDASGLDAIHDDRRCSSGRLAEDDTSLGEDLAVLVGLHFDPMFFVPGHTEVYFCMDQFLEVTSQHNRPTLNGPQDLLLG
jgi:hypothetical protein